MVRTVEGRRLIGGRLREAKKSRTPVGLISLRARPPNVGTMWLFTMLRTFAWYPGDIGWVANQWQAWSRILTFPACGSTYVPLPKESSISARYLVARSFLGKVLERSFPLGSRHRTS